MPASPATNCVVWHPAAARLIPTGLLRAMTMPKPV